MKREFWESCWRDDRIAFHMPQVHPYLKEYLGELQLEAGGRIFVPLCGKSLDMIYLGQQGFDVLGVELSAQAVEAFFSENAIPPQCSRQGTFSRYQGGPFDILCGDFFTLSPQQVAVRGVFDRGSLVAMPPSMRCDYAAQLTKLLAPEFRVLLISFDYDPAEMDGPPFTVSDAEIEALYGSAFEIRKLTSRPALEQNPPLKARGLSRLEEKVHLLIRKS